MKTIKRVFSDNLRMRRRAKHLTQAELAERANIPLATYQRAENGKIPISKNLAAIAKALDIGETELFLDPDLPKSSIPQMLALLRDALQDPVTFEAISRALSTWAEKPRQK